MQRSHRMRLIGRYDWFTVEPPLLEVRSMLRQLCLVFAVGCVLGAATPSCGGSNSGSSAANACLACGQTKCPSESSACDASSGCKTLRSCELECQTGDNACTNACVSK